jgi:hypothetical protein
VLKTKVTQIDTGGVKNSLDCNKMRWKASRLLELNFFDSLIKAVQAFRQFRINAKPDRIPLLSLVSGVAGEYFNDSGIS